MEEQGAHATSRQEFMSVASVKVIFMSARKELCRDGGNGVVRKGLTHRVTPLATGCSEQEADSPPQSPALPLANDLWQVPVSGSFQAHHTCITAGSQ